MSWKNSNVWKNSERVPIVVNGVIEGYKKRSGNLAFYWINRAGHSVSLEYDF